MGQTGAVAPLEGADLSPADINENAMQGRQIFKKLEIYTLFYEISYF